MECEQWFGKYRGKVIHTNDEKNLGRIWVNVPTVMGKEENWAMPAAPFAGVQAGVFTVPPPKANVWVEFEEGDPGKPIWSGGFWDADTVPKAAVDPKPPTPHTLLLTVGGNLIHICDGKSAPLDDRGGIVLKSGNSTIIIGPEGIKIKSSKIEIDGLTRINGDALVIKK
jgi:Type VI secretion system/phage-baseplate injector OB domain